MEKKIAGLVGAVAALGTLTAVQAAPAPTPATVSPLEVNSYADLLGPIPNAVALLKTVDERPSSEGSVQLAQYHHHHHHYRRHRHHHHHHHHRY